MYIKLRVLCTYFSRCLYSYFIVVDLCASLQAHLLTSLSESDKVVIGAGIQTAAQIIG